MRHEKIPSTLFTENRARLKERLPAGSLVVVNIGDFGSDKVSMSVGPIKRLLEFAVSRRNDQQHSNP